MQLSFWCLFRELFFNVIIVLLVIHFPPPQKKKKMLNLKSSILSLAEKERS